MKREMKPGDLLIYEKGLVTWPKLLRSNHFPEASIIGRVFPGQLVTLIEIISPAIDDFHSPPRTIKVISNDGKCGFITESYMKIVE
jgi:hypothetical protein